MSSGSEYKEGSSHLVEEEDKGIIKASLQMRFFVQFWCPFFNAIFVALELSIKIASEASCDFSAISVQFVTAISQRFRTCSKLDAMQLDGDFWETAEKSQRNRDEIASSLHLRQKLHWRVRQKSHQKPHV